MGKTTMSDLPEDLVGKNILTRIPITSLIAVLSTCKAWKALSKDWRIAKAEARHQFAGFMMMNFKVCSVRFDVRNKDIDVSIKPVDLLKQVDVLKVFHCDGLLLCVTKDLSFLVAWNPYIGQTRSILPRTSFHRLDKYALGYDIKRNHKILRFIDNLVEDGPHMPEFEIYDFSSGSWRVLEPTPNLHIEFHQRGVSLKGDTYFYSKVKVYGPIVQQLGQPVRYLKKVKDFLLCFDFTTERFGPRMRLPFQSEEGDIVTLSCVRQEKLAVLRYHTNKDIFEIWVTTKIARNSVSWFNFLKVNFFEMKTKPLNVARHRRHLYEKINRYGGSFFIDEEEKVVMVFDINGYEQGTPRYNTAFILGEDGFSKSTRLGEAIKIGEHGSNFCIPLVCSSAYLPSMVQVSQSEPPQKLK